MTDFAGPLRPADSWSATEVRSLTHNHVWTIRGFSKCDCRYLETSTKVKDLSSGASSASSSNGAEQFLVFRVRLHPQGNKESNKDFTFFQCFSNHSSNQFKAKYKFSVFNSRNDEIATTVYTGTQQLHGYFEYIRRDLLISHVLPQDEVQINLELSVTFDTITKTSQLPKTIGPPSPKPSEVARDLEDVFLDPKLSDFTIAIGEKEFAAHKVILAARSAYFKAMLEPHTAEAQSCRVDIKEVDADVMAEILRFMYTGNSPNIQSLALELLSAADRFNLPGLKNMADHVLRQNLIVDSVCRNMVYADMFNSPELKNECVRFIATNVHAVVQTEGWADLSKNHPEIVTEVLLSVADKKNHSSSASSSSGEPPAKRLRNSPPIE